MKKYVEQKDKFRCAPVAILNALIWAEQDVSYKNDIERLTEKCHCVAPHGTYHTHFVKALISEGRGVFRVQEVRRPSINQIEQHLRSSGYVIINFQWKGRDQRHFAGIAEVSDTGKCFSVVNMYVRTPALYTCHRETMIHKTRHRNDHSYKAWFLTKKD